MFSEAISVLQQQAKDTLRSHTKQHLPYFPSRAWCGPDLHSQIRKRKGKGKWVILSCIRTNFLWNFFLESTACVLGSLKLEENIFLLQPNIFHFPHEQNSQLTELRKCSWSYSSDFSVLYPYKSNLLDCQETFLLRFNWERGQRRGEEKEVSGKMKTTQGKNNSGQVKV